MNKLNIEDIETEAIIKIKELLADDKFEEADDIATNVVISSGINYNLNTVERLYAPLWSYSSAKRRGRLTSYIFQTMSRVDNRNIYAEQIRNRLLLICSEKYPVKDRPINKIDLHRLLDFEEFHLERDLWMECFESLHKFCINGEVVKLRNWQTDKNASIVLTSGSGRSGSSAIFDWINTFSEVNGVRQQHHNLRDLAFILKKGYGTAEYKISIVNYFFRNVLGFFIYTGKHEWLRAKWSRLIREKEGSVVKNILTSFLMVLQILAEKRSESILSRFDELLRAYLVSHEQPKNFFAATGWIDFDLADMFQYLPSAHIVCSIRDPRDIFVEHCKLTRGFNKDVHAFTRDYEEKMTFLHKQNLTKMQNVHVVNFNNFVTDSKLRNQLASNLNINSMANIKTAGSYLFNAEKSMKNVGVYNEKRYQQDIKIIEEKCPSYFKNYLTKNKN